MVMILTLRNFWTVTGGEELPLFQGGVSIKVKDVAVARVVEGNEKGNDFAKDKVGETRHKVRKEIVDDNAIVVHATEGMDLRQSGRATCGDGDLGLQWFQGSDGGKHN